MADQCIKTHYVYNLNDKLKNNIGKRTNCWKRKGKNEYFLKGKKRAVRVLNRFPSGIYNRIFALNGGFRFPNFLSQLSKRWAGNVFSRRCESWVFCLNALFLWEQWRAVWSDGDWGAVNGLREQRWVNPVSQKPWPLTPGWHQIPEESGVPVESKSHTSVCLAREG